MTHRCARMADPPPISYPPSSAGTRRMLEEALNGGKAAMRELVTTLRPVIRARIVKILTQSALRPGQDGIHRETDEFVQEVWVELLRDDARALRNWSPERGMGLLGYIGLVTERTTYSILRSRRQAARRMMTSTVDEGDDMPDSIEDPAPTPESRYAKREFEKRALELLRATLSEKGARILDMSILEGRTVEEICEALGMSEECVYTWRSRILKRADSIVRTLMNERTEDDDPHREEIFSRSCQIRTLSGE